MNSASLESELADARDKLDNQLDDLVQLRPLPALAVKIMQACRQEKTDARQLVQLIECDPTMASRILSVVNSSLFGYSREVVSINQAVVVLGFNSLTQLAVSIASEKVFSHGDDASKPRLELYEHSLGCASVAKLLATAYDTDVDAGAAFLAGMLHDVGKLVFFDVAPNYYSQLWEDRSDQQLVDQEREVFGVDHATIGKKFGDSWGLPVEINTAIGGHHDPVSQSIAEISSLTVLANELSKTWGIGQFPCETDCGWVSQWIEDQPSATLEDQQQQAAEHFLELKSLLTI